jgi:hypothetical protein
MKETGPTCKEGEEAALIRANRVPTMKIIENK